MLKGVDKGNDGKDKPFIFLKRQSIRKKGCCQISRKSLKKNHEYCINVFASVCFVEEVILADDENENDYDGMLTNVIFFCIY